MEETSERITNSIELKPIEKRRRGSGQTALKGDP